MSPRHFTEYFLSLREVMKETANHDNDAVAYLLTSRAPLLQKISQSRSRRTRRQRAGVGITKSTETVSHSDHAHQACRKHARCRVGLVDGGAKADFGRSDRMTALSTTFNAVPTAQITTLTRLPSLSWVSLKRRVSLSRLNATHTPGWQGSCIQSVLYVELTSVTECWLLFRIPLRKMCTIVPRRPPGLDFFPWDPNGSHQLAKELGTRLRRRHRGCSTPDQIRRPVFGTQKTNNEWRLNPRQCMEGSFACTAAITGAHAKSVLRSDENAQQNSGSKCCDTLLSRAL